jgi:hypothetical protein
MTAVERNVGTMYKAVPAQLSADAKIIDTFNHWHCSTYTPLLTSFPSDK